MLFGQQRLGYRRRPFSIIKIRTMRDGQITRVGKVLRATGLDEIPQFINIPSGERSAVGPRPLTEGGCGVSAGPGSHSTFVGDKARADRTRPACRCPVHRRCAGAGSNIHGPLESAPRLPADRAFVCGQRLRQVARAATTAPVNVGTRRVSWKTAKSKAGDSCRSAVRQFKLINHLFLRRCTFPRLFPAFTDERGTAMMNKTVVGIALLGLLAQGVAGCGGTDSSSTPSGPSPVAPQAAPPAPMPGGPQVRIGGSVYDTAWRPVPGVRVEVLDGPSAGVTATSDGLGAFSLIGAFDAGIRFRAAKAGYVEATLTSGVPCATCSPYLSFRLALDAPAVDLEGRYTLTFAAACTAIPEYARTRTYAATITRHPDVASGFLVSLADASLVRDLAWEGVFVGAAGDYIAVHTGNLHGDPGLIEQVAANAYIGFDGSAGGPMGHPGTPTLKSRFDGLIAYCEVPPGSPPPVVSGRFACPPVTSIANVQCTSPNHQLTLTKR